MIMEAKPNAVCAMEAKPDAVCDDHGDEFPHGGGGDIPAWDGWRTRIRSNIPARRRGRYSRWHDQEGGADIPVGMTKKAEQIFPLGMTTEALLYEL
jgi:hypothetical protein